LDINYNKKDNLKTSQILVINKLIQNKKEIS